jgi:hypothetical protein
MKTRFLFAVAVLAQIACLGSPRLVNERTSDYLQTTNPSKVWATLADGEQMEIVGPRVLNDTIFGRSEGKDVAVATDNVKQVKVRQVSAFRTALIPAVILGGIGATVFLVKHDPEAPLPVDSFGLNRCRYNYGPDADVANCT